MASGIKFSHLTLGTLAVGAFLLTLRNHHNPTPTPNAPNNIDNPPLLHRRLSEALPNGGCKITWPKPPPPNIQITYAASYPGCGARMTWNLVEALTGLETGDDWNNNGRGEKVVTVKTHYPQSNGILPEFDDKIQRAFLVVRNPMQSIPSFFNHIYEMRNHLPVHSERAPVEEWIKWRDTYLEEEIREYKKFHVYWMDRIAPDNRYVITYEGLTDDLIGAEVTKGLSEFLGRAEGVEVIDKESVACVWKAVVKNQPPEHQKQQIEKLEKLKAGSEKELGGKVAVGSVPNVANAPPAQTNAAPAMDMNAAVSSNTQQMTQQPPEKPLQTMYLDQTQQQFQGAGVQMPYGSQTQYQQAPPNSQQQFFQQMPPQNQMFQQTPQQQMMSSQNQMFQQPQMQQSYNQYPQQQYQQPMQMQYQQPMQTMQYQQQPGNLRHRRLDPGHHDSQRKGPNVPRPYTVKQLELMIQMLKELGDKYSDDVRVANIMKGYYEKVEKARDELAAGGGGG